jgi:glycosyltransferase involved in cell wall biosynthesis
MPSRRRPPNGAEPGNALKVLIVHYRFYEWGGPERYLFGIKASLEAAGHEVIPFSLQHGRNEPSAYQEYFAPAIGGGEAMRFGEEALTPDVVLRKLGGTFYSSTVERCLDRLITDVRPDVMYVLQYLRHLSPAVLAAARRHDIPVVVRLSDYQMVCPQADLLRGARVCEDCLESGSFWPSVRHACVRGSRTQSLVDALATQYHRLRGYFDAVDRFVAPSQVVLEKMVKGGFDRDRFVVIPTFVDSARFTPGTEPPGRRKTVAYVGQLRPEKGVDVLVRAWRAVPDRERAGMTLVIAGTGSAAFEATLRELAAGDPTIDLTGTLPRDGVERLLRDSRVSVIPSVCYENLPNSLLESYASGTPVIASGIGSLLEVVTNGETGWTFEPGNEAELAALIRRAIVDSDTLDAMAVRARARAVDAYGPALHLTRLVALFTRLLPAEADSLAMHPSWT